MKKLSSFAPFAEILDKVTSDRCELRIAGWRDNRQAVGRAPLDDENEAPLGRSAGEGHMR